MKRLFYNNLFYINLIKKLNVNFLCLLGKNDLVFIRFKNLINLIKLLYNI